jgi:hypothetical protein
MSLRAWQAAAPPAAPEIRKEQVTFKPGEIGAAVKGRIEGEQIVDQILQAEARQTAVVLMGSSNSSCCFNVTAPGDAAGTRSCSPQPDVDKHDPALENLLQQRRNNRQLVPLGRVLK